MSVHPVLVSLRARMHLEFEDDNTALYHIVNKKRDVHTVRICSDLSSNDIEVEYCVHLRSSFEATRTKMYINALKKLVNPEFIVFEVCGRGVISGLLECKGECAYGPTVDDMAEYIQDQLYLATVFFETVTMVTRICYRLQNRSGTMQYRKLLPTTLAHLTVCGMNPTDSIQ